MPTKRAPQDKQPATVVAGTSVRARKIDSKLTDALKDKTGKKLTVMVKFVRGAPFASLPRSNEVGSARSKAFERAVDGLVGNKPDVRIVQRAANVGVATVQAPASVVRDLIGSSELENIQLLRS